MVWIKPVRDGFSGAMTVAAAVAFIWGGLLLGSKVEQALPDEAVSVDVTFFTVLRFRNGAVETDGFRRLESCDRSYIPPLKLVESGYQQIPRADEFFSIASVADGEFDVCSCIATTCWNSKEEATDSKKQRRALRAAKIPPDNAQVLLRGGEFGWPKVGEFEVAIGDGMLRP